MMLFCLLYYCIFPPVPRSEAKVYVLEYKKLLYALTLNLTSKFQDEVALFSASPSTLSTSCIAFLLHEFDKEATPHAIDKDYVWKQDTHDLNQRRGRAAYIIDRLASAKLPLITPTATVDVFKKCKQCAIDSLVKSIRDIHKTSKSQMTTAEASLAFRGLVVPIDRTHKLQAHPDYMLNRLVSKWDPIGRKLADFQTVLGRKLEPSNTEQEFVFRYTVSVSGNTWNSPFKDRVCFNIVVLTDADDEIIGIASNVTS